MKTIKSKKSTYDFEDLFDCDKLIETECKKKKKKKNKKHKSKSKKSSNKETKNKKITKNKKHKSKKYKKFYNDKKLNKKIKSDTFKELDDYNYNKSFLSKVLDSVSFSLDTNVKLSDEIAKIIPVAISTILGKLITKK